MAHGIVILHLWICLLKLTAVKGDRGQERRLPLEDAALGKWRFGTNFSPNPCFHLLLLGKGKVPAGTPGRGCGCLGGGREGSLGGAEGPRPALTLNPAREPLCWGAGRLRPRGRRCSARQSGQAGVVPEPPPRSEVFPLPRWSVLTLRAKLCRPALHQAQSRRRHRRAKMGQAACVSASPAWVPAACPAEPPTREAGGWSRAQSGLLCAAHEHNGPEALGAARLAPPLSSPLETGQTFTARTDCSHFKSLKVNQSTNSVPRLRWPHVATKCVSSGVSLVSYQLPPDGPAVGLDPFLPGSAACQPCDTGQVTSPLSAAAPPR